MKKQSGEEVKWIFERISHEIRMPVSIAMGYLQLIERGMVTDNQEKEQYIERVGEQIAYLDSYLRSISSVSWIPDMSTGKADLNMAEFLTSMLPDMRCAANGKGVEVELDLCREPIVISADSDQLKIVFYNLLENSIRYTPSGGRITVALSKRGGGSRIMWKDNGIGMKEEEVSRIFEYGYQGSESAGGSGLGLYMVKQLLEYQQADICAKSLPGQGMTFYICFGQDL